MESSEEEDDFPSIESIIPQSKIDSVHQSLTEKGIRKLCCELLDLKDAVENLCGDMRTKYLAFLRISEEAVEMEHELVELRKHISSQGILVQDLLAGVCREMDEWNNQSAADVDDLDNSELMEPVSNGSSDPNSEFLEKIDVLLAEHKGDSALEAMETEERNNPDLKGSVEMSSYKSAFMERKAALEDQFLRIAKQPSVSIAELKQTLNGLIRLGKGPSAHQLLLKFYASNIHKRIESFLPSCSICPNTFPATLSKLVFSNISVAAKESAAIFGDDNPAYSNKVVQWAEREVEYLVRLVKENASPSETVSALRAASVCLQDSLNYCKVLEPQGLILSKLFLVLFRPYVEEVLELNFRRARKVIFDLTETDLSLESSTDFVAALSEFAIASDTTMTDCSIRFMQIVHDILEQLTPLVVLHFGESVLTRILQLYDKYIDFLIKALPGHSDEDGLLPELQETVIITRAETDSEQLSLLGAAFTILDELLPKSLVEVWNLRTETDGESVNAALNTSSAPELKEWKRHMLQAFDKLRNYFCLQFVLSFIYSREGRTRLDAQIYLTEIPEDDLHLPSLPFQALFSKLQQLAIIAGDVLLGKEKLQKILLARLTETVIIWLSNEQEFWSAFEDESTPLQPFGLQQLILDMNFTVEIARFAGYPFKVVQNHASAVINRAINIFSLRGMKPQSSLPKTEWFTEAAKAAINRLLMGSEEASEPEEEVEEDEEEEECEDSGHIVFHGDDHDDDDDSGSIETSSFSSNESFESFASASMAELESPAFTDSES